MLAVVGGVAQKAIKVDLADGLNHGVGKLRGILAGTGTDHGTGPQMGREVADDGELGPGVAGQAFAALPPDVVAAGMTTLQSRGVNGARGIRVDQLQLARPAKDGVLEPVKSPFFSSRAWAFCSVV